MTASTVDQSQIMAQAGAVQAPGIAQCFDRRCINSSAFVPTSGTLYMSGIWLPAGVTVTNIVCFSGGTGVTTNTHFWVALYTNALALLAQSADDTGGTQFAANTKISKALSAPQVAPYSGIYYIGYQQAASTCNTVLTAAAPASSIANSDVPLMSATSSTGLNTGTAPNPAAALSGSVQSVYAYVT